MSRFFRTAALGLPMLVLLDGLSACSQNSIATGHRATRPQPNVARAARVVQTQPTVRTLDHMARAVRTASRIPGPTVPDGLGVNIHWTDPRPGEMRMLAATGVRWIRMDFAWSATETKKGQHNFSQYTRLITALRRYHIGPLLILDYGNPLYQHGAFPTTAIARHAFVKWAVVAVKAFRGNGVIWEMWNEPNGGMGNNGVAVRPSFYAGLVGEVGQAIHRADPRAQYVGPALAGMDRPWLKRILQDGVLKEFDAVTVHPYRQTPPETAAGDYANFRELIARYAPVGKDIPILSGEWGYSTAAMKRDANRQGKFLARGFLTNLMCHIPISIWYDWHNDGAIGLGHAVAGSIKIAGIGTSTNSKAVENFNLFAKNHPWTFYNGAEFPGARGSFNLGKDRRAPTGILKYNFAGGGSYVEANCNVSVGKISALSFKVKSAQRQQMLIRIVDRSGQTLQFYRSYSGANHWQRLRVDLAYGSAMHWGGHNNGQVDFPITAISIGVNSPFHPQESHFGMVKFKYHPHRHWVYTPKPAFFACRTLTRQLRGFHFEKRLVMKNPNDFVLAFACGKQRRWVAWSMVKPKPGKGVITLPVSPGTYRVTNYLGAEHVTARAGAAGLKLQLSTGPQYIVPRPAASGEN